DWDALAALPTGTLGSAYRSLATRDRIRVGDLVEADRKHRSGEPEVQEWLRARLIGSHDLLHVITGYERDSPGEMLLIAFTHGIVPKRIFRVILFFGLFGTPLRHLPRFLVDLRRAWRRGRDANIPRSTHWEHLLALPLDEARLRLEIAPAAATHNGRIWREEPTSGAWTRVELTAA
ncbi:MAG: Coq4 family protein, partial [Myxococcota bacterium]|nr:Coq4 family protein [Myxococcota bacterium]